MMVALQMAYYHYFFSYPLFAINYKHLVSKNQDTFTYFILLYNVLLVSAVQQSESAICPYTYILLSLVPPSHLTATLLGHQRAPGWAPYVI